MESVDDDVVMGVRRVAARLDDLSAPRAMTDAMYVRPQRSEPRRHRVLVGAVALFMVVAAAVAAIIVTADDQVVSRSGDGDSRVLLDAPGWKITRHDEQPENGSVHFETTFKADGKELDLHQRPPGYNEEFMASSSNVVVLGNPGVLWPAGGEFRGFWRDGGWDFELRGGPVDEAEFRSLLASLRYVDDATWEAALPNTVVKPADRAAVVDEMLREVPLPPGLDISAVKESARQRDRYQLGAQVIKPVLCAWMIQWVDAQQSGDVGAQQQALDALNSSRNWPVLIEMSGPGDLPEFVWSEVDALQHGSPRPTDTPEVVAQRFLQSFSCT